ncbi:MAG: hypothetical protein Q8J69_04880 [Sphingobacteriaceae bacterium]|nr:hypothetical protein [Sphingobacteriaceae bacterium]
MSLLTAVSSWYLLGCILIGLLYALLLYYRSGSQFSQAWLRYPLAVLRGSVVALVVLLLFNPYLKSEQKVTEKPLIVVAFDNSQSLLHETDSATLHASLDDFANQAAGVLSQQHELRLLSFGAGIDDSLKRDFTAKATNISGLLQGIEDRYSGQQLAAIVLLSDGIYNRGFEPINLGENIGVPIYTIPLGDTTLRQDLIVKAVRANQVVYINSDFTILADLEINRLNGRKASIKLESIGPNGSKLISKQEVVIDKERFFTTIQFIASAEKAGINRYRISADITAEAKEQAGNNSKDLFVEVMDQRTQILMVAHAPHPDLSAIRQALEVNPQYRVDIMLASQAVQIKEKPDVVILHQLPSTATYSSQWLQAVEQLQVPSWHILGSQTNIAQFNKAQSLLQISSRSGGIQKIQADFNSAFRAFTIENAIQEKVGTLPPMDAPFGDFRLSPQATPLLFQRIGSLNTDMPLWAFAPNSIPRQAILTAEGLWRWKLAQAESRYPTDITSELIRKTIQFLAVKQDKRPFQVRTNRKLYPEQESILFEAELYNQNYEPVNEPEVRLVVLDENKQRYIFSMGRTQQQYFFNAGALPPGTYTYTATTSLGGINYQANGNFVVTVLDLEKTNTVANHEMLASLSARSGGHMLPLSEKERLFELLQANESVRPVVYYETRIRELISFEAILILLGLLLALEWFLRRYAGSY